MLLNLDMVKLENFSQQEGMAQVKLDYKVVIVVEVVVKVMVEA